MLNLWVTSANVSYIWWLIDLRLYYTSDNIQISHTVQNYYICMVYMYVHIYLYIDDMFCATSSICLARIQIIIVFLMLLYFLEKKKKIIIIFRSLVLQFFCTHWLFCLYFTSYFRSCIANFENDMTQFTTWIANWK